MMPPCGFSTSHRELMITGMQASITVRLASTNSGIIHSAVSLSSRISTLSAMLVAMVEKTPGLRECMELMVRRKPFMTSAISNVSRSEKPFAVASAS